MLIVGDRELETGMLAVRNRFEGDLGAMSVEQFSILIRDLVDTKAVKP